MGKEHYTDACKKKGYSTIKWQVNKVRVRNVVLQHVCYIRKILTALFEVFRRGVGEVGFIYFSFFSFGYFMSQAGCIKLQVEQHERQNIVVEELNRRSADSRRVLTFGTSPVFSFLSFAVC